MAPDKVSVVCRRIGLVTSLLGPFAYGGVSPFLWPALAWLWIAIGLITIGARQLQASPGPAPGRLLPLPLVGFYLLMMAQLVPLPAGIIRWFSSGSFAAHFLPGSVERTWATLTVSPTGSWQALLYIAGLHGLSVALFYGADIGTARRQLFAGMAAVGGVLALEGLVQAQSAHPFSLYGIWKVPGIGSHERGVFGPYYNRDHYSNLIAIAGSVSAGLLGYRIKQRAFGSLKAFVGSADFSMTLALIAGLLLMMVASAASGSRGGLVAFGVGLLVAFGPAALVRPRLALAGLIGCLVLLFATGVPAAFARMGDADFEASRLMVWRDIARLATFFPIFGCGIGAFAPAYWPYQRVVRFEYWPHVHNEYLQWFIEGGALGALIAIIFLRQVWIAAPRIVRSVEARPALAGVAAGFTHALVDCTLRVPANAAWVWLLATVLFVAVAPSTGEQN
ncbi:MAG: O-antigen ligase family protein [Vicinamibacteria bacterium]